jgi:peptide/nickel transport system substrate-binding protein
MKKGIIWVVLTSLIVVSLILTSCSTSTSTSTTTTQLTVASTTNLNVPKTTPSISATVTPATTSTSTTTGNWWVSMGTPKYGGTFTYVVSNDPIYLDPYFAFFAPNNQLGALFYESLTQRSQTTDPKIFGNLIKVPIRNYLTGLLAESYELTDPQTLVFHIRQGIYYQNLPPLNGRELNANDIVYSWDRNLGQGYGFTKPTPYSLMPAGYLLVKSVTATDNWTVVFKASQASLDFFQDVTDPFRSTNKIIPKEIVDAYGDARNMMHTVGTGPFILSDYVAGSSITAARNPNYWGYDELYPQNKLPYVNEVKILIIPDLATSEAAFRTGKVDLLESLTADQAASLQKTNPNLQLISRPSNGWTLGLRIDKAPFNDIKVREAMQMALDLNAIASSYYKGNVSATPAGLLSPVLVGYAFPYAQWDTTVQAQFKYDPTAAKQLLAQAGFPSGFKTTMIETTSDDGDFYQIIKSYLNAIGIDMTINVMDTVSYTNYIQAGKQDACFSLQSVKTETPSSVIRWRYSGDTVRDESHVSDPAYDALIVKSMSTVDISDYMKITQACDYYDVQQHWVIGGLGSVNFCVSQPSLKRYWGQFQPEGAEMARFWKTNN